MFFGKNPHLERRTGSKGHDRDKTVIFTYDPYLFSEFLADNIAKDTPFLVFIIRKAGSI